MTQIEISGLIIHDMFLSHQESEDLIKIIDSIPEKEWKGDGIKSRRSIQFGYIYSDEQKGIDWTQKPTEFPDWLQKIIEKIQESKYMSLPVAQVFINEYKHHQGIQQHIDSLDFGPEICSLSLGHSTAFTFTHDLLEEKDKEETENPKTLTVKMMVFPQSLLVMTGDARYKWKHGIPYSKLVHMDHQKTFKRPNRFRRISLTFRSLAPENVDVV